MQQAQVIVYEADGRIASRLQDLSSQHAFVVREVRRPEACTNALERYGPGVVVLKIGRDLERELGLLEQLSWLHPETAVLVLGDSDNRVLADLCWDLGAQYVLFPPQPFELLGELVLGFLHERV